MSFGATPFSFGGTTTTKPGGTGGFTFGANTGTSQTGGGLTFGQPAATTAPGGFTFGAQTTAPTGGGLTFGQPAGTATGTTGGGFGFGGGTSTTQPGGFTLGQTTSTGLSSGLNLRGTAPTTSSTVGFNFGGTTGIPPTTSAGVGFNFSGTSGTAPATTSSTVGFNLGGTTAQTQPATGLNFGGTTSSTGLTLGGLGGTTAATTGLNLGGATQTATSTTGFTLGGTSTVTQASTGFNFGATPAGVVAGSATPGLGLLGSKPTTTTSTSGFALKLPSSTATTTSTGIGLSSGLFPNKTTAATGTTGLAGFANPSFPSGLGGTSTAGLGGTNTGILGSTSTTGSIFNTVTSKPATIGLGGVDPKTSTVSSGGTTADSKPGDGKTLKQTTLPPEIVSTVNGFKKYVKEEKSVQDNLSRMSSKPMFKVQEDVAALKQLLSVVSNGLQRNACAVETLKRDMTQELKNAEMSQRTKDIPPGLQYENTAPTEYFQKLVDDFENQMLSYRQQIETLEGHLASLTQPNKFTAEELIGLLRKLHETFIALAAQLHQVHEAVKTQKEHYLNYRKIFLHDSKNIFEREKKGATEVKIHHIEGLGPNPFTGMSNATAVAMATALARSQQPSSVPPVAGLGQTGLTTTGLFGATTTTTGFTGFGGTATTTQSGFGGFGGFGTGQTSGFKGFGAPTTTTQPSTGFGFGTSGGTATVRPLGFGSTGSTGLFGQTGTSTFGQTQTATPGLTLGATAPVFGTATPQLNVSAQTEAPFQLNKPPGSKRGKR